MHTFKCQRLDNQNHRGAFSDNGQVDEERTRRIRRTRSQSVSSLHPSGLWEAALHLGTNNCAQTKLLSAPRLVQFYPVADGIASVLPKEPRCCTTSSSLTFHETRASPFMRFHPLTLSLIPQNRLLRMYINPFRTFSKLFIFPFPIIYSSSAPGFLLCLDLYSGSAISLLLQCTLLSTSSLSYKAEPQGWVKLRITHIVLILTSFNIQIPALRESSSPN